MTLTPTRSRLPGRDRDSRGKEVLLGVLALVGTGLLVVGVPVLLLAAFGPPWPDTMPSPEWLARKVDAETVMAILAGVVWLAWAHFVLCLVVETVAEVRRRGLAPRVPGGGIGTQALARKLVAAIVLLTSPVTIGMGAAHAADAPGGAATGVTQSSLGSTDQATVDPAAQGTFTSPHTLGQLGAEQTPNAIPEHEQLSRASRAEVAAGAITYYEVKPPQGRNYDTLWGIAERYLGDGRRYREIYDLNQGLLQADGRDLRNADLIMPGWVVRLPADAKGPGLKVVRNLDGIADGSAAPAALISDDGGTADPLAAGVAAGESPGVTFTSAVSESVRGWTPLFGVAGGLAIAGVALGLRRRRNGWTFPQLLAARGAGGSPDPEGPPDPGSGARLRDEADPSTAAWLDGSLRTLTSGGGLPATLGVALSDAGLVLAFESAPDRELPAGWRAHSETMWSRARDAVSTGSGISALPGLVSVGRRDDGGYALVDLEWVPGIVAVEGPDEVARGLALSFAIDTATHAWADERVVTLVGFAEDFGDLAPGVIRHADHLDRVLDGLVNVAEHQRALCAAGGHADFSAARAAGVPLTYHLVVCSGVPTPAELAQLHTLAADPQVAAAVVVVGAVAESALRLGTGEDGRVRSPLRGLDVAGQILGLGALRALSEQFASPPDRRGASLEDLLDAMDARAAAVAAPEAAARVDLLGPVTVTASGPVEEPRRRLLTELAAFVALHPEGVHLNRLGAAIWPRGVDSTVLQRSLAQLGEWLGSTPDGDPVLVVEAGVVGFRPGTVGCDWDQFREALNRAVAAGGQREAHLRAALELVRAVPLTDGAGEPGYAWLENGTWERDILLAIGLTTQALAEAAAERGDAEAAASVLERGLQLLPASEDLWRARLAVAERFADTAEIQRVAEAMYAQVSRHGSPLGISATTQSLVAELLPGWTPPRSIGAA